MQFLTPLFAIAGAVAALGPVIIHLLNRRRFRVVNWAAIDFLREAMKRSRRVVQLRDLLLLALRTACVLLLGLALARPYFTRQDAKADPDQPVHAVLIVDNSLSMGYQRLDGTLLDDAKARARDFIERVPQGSRISVIPLCGSTTEFSWDAYRTKEDALEALSAIEVVDRSGNAAQAADLARQACQQAEDLPSKRVVFLGDQQRSNWPADGLEGALQELPEMQVVQVMADDPENAWISDFKVQDGIADIETPTTFVATVRYEGPTERPNVPVTLTIDGVQASSRAIDLEPGQAREVSFSYRFDIPAEPGQPTFSTAEVAIPADRLEADDRRYLAVPVVAALPVVFIDQYGNEEDPRKNQYGETFRWRRLLAPVTTRGDYGRQLIQVRRATIEQVDRELLQDARLVIMAGVERPDAAVPLLRDYVQQGGQLVIAAGGNFDARRWTEAAWLDGAGILPAPLAPDPVGQLPEEAPGDLKPFYLSFSSMVHDYFQLENAPREELADLYQLPLFFKAVAPDVSDDTVQTMTKAEAGRLAEERRFLAESDARRQAWSEQEAAGSLTEADRQSREQDDQRRMEIEPNWLLWHSADQAALDPRLKPQELARLSRPRVLVAFTNGVPCLVERNMGRGQVLFFSSGVQSEWNTLTKTNAVLMFDRIFRGMLERTLPRRNLTSVEKITLPVQPHERHAQFTLERPGETAGEPLIVEALGPDTFGLTIRNVAARGLYRVTAERAASAANEGLDSKLWQIPLAVNGPPAESELISIDEAALKERLGDANYRWVPPGSPISLEGAYVRGQNLWKWLMLALLVGLLLELLILFRWGRPVPIKERVA